MAKIAGELDYVGVLTGEFFATDDGPVFNEMAPRVHNSGHWTIEGAVTSQFENHIRAVAGLPLGSRSEEHTSELQSLMRISYADFFLNINNPTTPDSHADIGAYYFPLQQTDTSI